ncbi:hypothetical protein EYR38_006441 [Pleurotus pulmonarius]|nr:hypothetical protein EYR38_006441 [Pleurotus pulmonarius]
MAQTVYTFDVDDISPSISYSPFADTFTTPDLLSGWNPYFTDSGFAAFQGQTGNGTSLHISALNGSSVSLQWRGTGIEIRGNVTNARYAVALDGQEPQVLSPQGDTLAKQTDLPDANHTITLTSLTTNPSISDSFIAFDKFIVTSIPVNDSSSLPIISNPLQEHVINFNGAWSFQNISSTGASHSSRKKGDRVATRFIGTAFSLRGTTSPSAGRFTVHVDGETTTLSGQSSFTNPDALLYFISGMNASMTHDILIINDEDRDLTVLSEGFIVSASGDTSPPEITPTPTPTPTSGTSTSFPRGTIAAFALAGILGFILITLVLLYFLIWRPRRQRRRWHTQHAPAPRPKEYEASDEVLDIGPSGPRGENSAGVAGFVERRESTRVIERWWERENRRGSGGSKGRDSKRASGPRTGFAKWREEVEHGFGGRGLGGLGLVFRHSLGGTIKSNENNHGHLSEDEKSPTSPNTAQDKDDDDAADADAPQNHPSSNDNNGISVVSRIISGKQVKTKKKKSTTSMSATKKGDSPSFTIDLPLPTLPRNGGSSRSSLPHTNHPSRLSGSTPQSARLPVPSAQQRSSSHSQSGSTSGSNQAQPDRAPTSSDSSAALSYISSPVYPVPDQPPGTDSSSAPSSAPVPMYTPMAITTNEVAASGRMSVAPRPLPRIRPQSETPSPRTLPISGNSGNSQRLSTIRPLPVPIASPSVWTPPTHIRSESSGFLLRADDPNVASGEDDGYHPTEYRAPDVSPLSGREQGSTLSPPPKKGDRGSVSSSYVTDMDGLVQVETTAGQAAIRGLRPRISQTRPFGYPEGRSTPSLSIDTSLTPSPRQREKAKKRESVEPQPALPEVGETSPFRVDFSTAIAGVGRESSATAGPSKEARPSSASASVGRSGNTKSRQIRALPHIPSLGQKSSFRLTPPSFAPLGSPGSEAGVLSFLDFGGSREGSIVTQSNDSSSDGKPKSRWSGPSIITSLHRRPSVNPPLPDVPVTLPDIPQERRNSKPRPQSQTQSESSGKGSNSSSNFPFPVSLSPPSHPGSSNTRQHTRQSLPRPPDASHANVPSVNIIGSSPSGSTQNVETVRPHHPSGLTVGGEAASPTDSLPISVSDLHFRHSDSESTSDSLSRRASAGSHLPPHPPLPSQQELGHVSAEYVQRVLGLTPPQSATFPSHRRQESGPR